MGKASKGSLFGQDIAIDLGTSTCLVYVKGRGVILQESSVVAVNRHTGKVLTVGEEAERMLSQTPGDLVAVCPFRSGVISDYAMTERMLREILHKASSSRVFKPRLVISIPVSMTEVEERALIDAGLQAGAKRVYLLEKPLAAALGAGIDITKADGAMVVDIGAGSCDIAVLSLSNIVESVSLKAAGNQFDEAIVKYIRRTHNVLIGERIAEELKRSIGCVLPRVSEVSADVKGRSLTTGLPETFSITSTDMVQAFQPVFCQILEGIQTILERTPPELVADIEKNGILLTGGGSLLYGFDRLITRHTGIKTRLLDDPNTAVVLGAGKTLENLFALQEGAKIALSYTANQL